MVDVGEEAAQPRLPRVTIQFCTQCKWMLRAAYYAQELLSTFSVSLGEVALRPATGGVFAIDITTSAFTGSSGNTSSTTTTASDNSDNGDDNGNSAITTRQTSTDGSYVSPNTAPTTATGPLMSPGTAIAITSQITRTQRIWDRKTDGGFPETKELKRRVRDVIQPERDLGHVDREYPKSGKRAESGKGAEGEEKGAGKGEKGKAKGEGKDEEGKGKESRVEEGAKKEVCEPGKCEDCE